MRLVRSAGRAAGLGLALALVCLPVVSVAQAPAPTTTALPEASAHSSEGTTASENAVGVPFTLDACLATADSSNPSAQSAWHAWQAALGAARGAGSLPDPMVSYGYSITPVETRVGPQEERFGLRQTLPWFGKLRLKSEAAMAGADAAYHRYRRAAADVEYAVVEAYAEYANLKITMGILERRDALLGDLESAVRAKYASGEAPYADLMRAEIERARVSDRLAAARGRRLPASARLAAAIGLEPGAPLPWPDDIPSLDAGVLRESSAEIGSLSPELLLLDSETERAERSRSLARRGYFPDLTLGVDYIVTGEATMPTTDSGKDPLSVSASIGVPLWFGKHAAAVREQSERLVATREMRRQKENELGAKLQMVLFEVDDAARRVTLYADQIVPDAEASLQSARSGYANGAVGFETVIAAEQMVLEMELALVLARVDSAKAVAGLKRLLAAGIPATPPDNAGHAQ